MKSETPKQMQTINKKPTTATYQSNPFSLSFNKFGLFFEKNLGWAIALIILPLIGMMLQMFGSFLDAVSINASAHNGHGNSQNLANISTPEAFGFLLVLVLFSLTFALILAVGIAFNIFVTGLFTYAALENDAGRKASFGGAIDAVVSRFWRLFLAQLLATAKIFGWTLLFIIPGIVAVFRYALLTFVILDEPASEKGVKSSHDRVKALVAGRKREVFGIATVSLLIPIIGNIVQLVGNSALYRQLQIHHDKNLEKPNIHWLNYLGFALLGIFIGPIILLIIVIVSLYSK